jgi:hypothetical protein
LIGIKADLGASKTGYGIGDFNRENKGKFEDFHRIIPAEIMDATPERLIASTPNTKQSGTKKHTYFWRL